MFAGIILLNLNEVFLSMRTDLNDILSFDMFFNEFPIATVFLQSVKKSLMFGWSPVLAMLGDDVGFARFLGWEGIGGEMR